MALDKKSISCLEEHFPELAEIAFKQAYWAALAAGNSVLIRSELLKIYINPDDIEKEIQTYHFLDLEKYSVPTTAKEILNFFTSSRLLKTENLLADTHNLRFH